MRRLVDAVCPPRLGRDFRFLLASSWATNLADGISLAAGPLLVASATSNPLLVAMAALLQRLPWLLFGLYAGVVADRVDRRRLVAAVDAARAMVLAVLAVTVMTGAVNVAVVLAAMFLIGTAEVFADVTSSTLLPMVVPQNDLGVANARLMTGPMVLNELIGPPLGAALFALAQWGAVSVQAATVALGAACISRMAATRPERHDADAPMRQQVREGLRWLWGHRPMRTLAITVLAFNITFGAAWAVLVLLAKQRLGLGPVGFGLLSVASAVGGLAGMAAYERLERRIGAGWIMRAGLVVETVTHLTLAITTLPLVAGAILFCFGVHTAAWGATSNAVRHRSVPTELQGRVGSIYLLGMMGSLVVGSAVGGVTANVWGVTAPFWFAFVGSLLILLAIWRELARIAD
ncbi:MAG TPA: MFS transporter [Acidimicrobiaceae bacterium]|nr:MFS transporter [Acidimicrobiaceae bacterium]